MNKMMHVWHTLCNRWLYLAGALVIAVLFGAALYLQYVLHQDPCPLCMVQRFIFVVLFIVFVLAALHAPGRSAAKVYGAVVTVLSLCGVAVAGRHIWIQHLPEDEVPACGPGLNYMLEHFPLSNVLKELMHGSGECAAKGWTFLTLGIPEWSLIGYVLLALWALLIAAKKPI